MSRTDEPPVALTADEATRAYDLLCVLIETEHPQAHEAKALADVLIERGARGERYC